ncbi:MAG: hypothetical protein OHK0052_26520 [Anaerolineales bacterium]
MRFSQLRAARAWALPTDDSPRWTMETKQQAEKLQAELEKHLAPMKSPEALETVLARVAE